MMPLSPSVASWRKDAFDLHADLRLGRVHDDLGGDLRALVELHNREHVGGEHRILLGRRVDHGKRDNRARARSARR